MRAAPWASRLLKNWIWSRSERRAAGFEARRRRDADAHLGGGGTKKTAARRPNPMGWRHLRRISSSLVVGDALASPSSSVSRSARKCQPARPSPVFQQPARSGASGRGKTIANNQIIDVFWAWGHGGQFIIVMPELDSVVVLTAKHLG